MKISYFFLAATFFCVSLSSALAQTTQASSYPTPSSSCAPNTTGGTFIVNLEKLNPNLPSQVAMRLTSNGERLLRYTPIITGGEFREYRTEYFDFKNKKFGLAYTKSPLGTSFYNISCFSLCDANPNLAEQIVNQMLAYSSAVETSGSILSGQTLQSASIAAKELISKLPKYTLSLEKSSPLDGVRFSMLLTSFLGCSSLQDVMFLNDFSNRKTYAVDFSKHILSVVTWSVLRSPLGTPSTTVNYTLQSQPREFATQFGIIQNYAIELEIFYTDQVQLKVASPELASRASAFVAFLEKYRTKYIQPRLM